MPTASKTISWRFIVLLAILIVLAVIYFRQPKPCRQPITYRIGNVDDRFGLTHQEFGSAVNRAAAMWGKPLSRHLFQEDPQGLIEINLVYDYRQEATDRLKKLNVKIDGSKHSYEELNSRLNNLKTEYEQKNTTLSGDFNVFNARLNAFNAEWESWNRRGGVPERFQGRLVKEKDELNGLRDNLQGRREEMKNLAYTINSLVVVINEIASKYNLDLVDRQNEGNTLGREFCEGLYEIHKGKRSITIYQFDDDSRLVRVLAHEFGHALGLPHSQTEKAVMYRLINSNSPELAPDDEAALRRRCKIKGPL